MQGVLCRTERGEVEKKCEFMWLAARDVALLLPKVAMRGGVLLYFARLCNEVAGTEETSGDIYFILLGYMVWL